MNKIREQRKKYKLKQKELAEIMRVSQGTISQWETGLTNPKTKMLPLLAKTLECEIEDLINIPA